MPGAWLRCRVLGIASASAADGRANLPAEHVRAANDRFRYVQAPMK